MAQLLLLTNTLAPSAEVVPALGLLSHHVRILPAEASALVDAPKADVVVVDARRELAMAKSLCRVICTTGISIPLIVVVTEGGLAGITGDWGVDDVMLDTAGPAEVEARLRLAVGAHRLEAARRGGRRPRSRPATSSSTRRPTRPGCAAALLDLTYKEFELLKYLAQHPGRVFTRAQLLQEVWGYDYFGGTRTVDVHVRRLRAKLGTEHEGLIGTVRNVGYRFVPRPADTPLPGPRHDGRSRPDASARPSATTTGIRRCGRWAHVPRRRRRWAAVSEACRRRRRPASRPGVVHLHPRPTPTDGAVVGYAQVAAAGTPDAVAELVVDPPARRHGHGRALLEAALVGRPPAQRVGARRCCRRRRLRRAAGLAMTRSLHRWRARSPMRLPWTPVAPARLLGAGVRAGPRRRDAWLAVNAARVRTAPEQGRMTVADLHEREAEPWFDPAGLPPRRRRDDRAVAAFHWTKVARADVGRAHGSGPTSPARDGEVYVVGVDPAYQGRGLGRPVTRLGLRAPRAGSACARSMLYVDGDNTAARRTYDRLGFTDAPSTCSTPLPRPDRIGS